jgi:hypothetical protein
VNTATERRACHGIGLLLPQQSCCACNNLRGPSWELCKNLHATAQCSALREFDTSTKLWPGPPYMPALCNHDCAECTNSHRSRGSSTIKLGRPTPDPTHRFPCSTTQPLCMGTACRSAPAALTGVEPHLRHSLVLNTTPESSACHRRAFVIAIVQQNHSQAVAPQWSATDGSAQGP